MNFRVGDTVQLLDEEGEGVILELLTNNRVIVEVHDFPFEYSITQIIKVALDNTVIHSTEINDFDHLLGHESLKRNKEVQLHIPIKVFDKVSKMGFPEIDLHIYELVDKPQHLTRSDMIQIQTFRLEQYIQNCMDSRVNEFVVIHGVGEGVLRLEVRKVLESHGNMKYEDADFREYGAGATHVRILGLFKGL